MRPSAATGRDARSRCSCWTQITSRSSMTPMDTWRVTRCSGSSAGSCSRPLPGAECRAIDRVCRYGGEEFAVIQTETSASAAPTLGERLRAAVERASFDISGARSISITVSIGVATYRHGYRRGGVTRSSREPIAWPLRTRRHRAVIWRRGSFSHRHRWGLEMACRAPRTLSRSRHRQSQDRVGQRRL
jgi:hypothetical protein